MSTSPQTERRALKLRDVRRLLEGVIPPAMCSVGADGMPHVNYLSHAEYIDDEHVALTYQFLNRARANILATGRVALSVEDPISGVSVLLQLRYLRTDTEGPVYERLRAKLAGIAAQTGMEKVFHLRGADLYRVESLRKLDPVRPLPGMAPRCDLAAGVRRLSEQLAEAADLRSLLNAFTQGLQQDLCISHAILWLLDEHGQGLFTLASIGYEQAGSGAELPLAEAGLAGVALRENVPIRIGHMSQMYSYGMSWRAKAEQLGLQAAMADTIPLPGLAAPRSQLAVPLRARGRSVGALLVESENDQFFSYDDEDALTAIGAQLAQGLAALHKAELIDAPAPPTERTPASGAALRIRHYPRDHSVFVNDQYLIKGVAGAIIAKLVRDQIASGRAGFSTRELRLAGDDLRLPEVQDNLGVRLLLLERRLAERDFGLRIERSGRGQYRLSASGPLEFVAAD
ncbi:GAF domain-containing protein [Paucibacter sp. XJ19-41]|uniref:GAF domain-containing protein n=1 Tax=Paucibacter sp. XJ19-41 TaxID=2927824 RepID=UPI00234B6DBC|nr:GAF domain-containing protein [Paucibacter sp. XJ19-41]MDC6169848.1 GAF domain-containing protein [Paucibacter sp. XJ19-41]